MAVREGLTVGRDLDPKTDYNGVLAACAVRSPASAMAVPSVAVGDRIVST
jgi:hypothetical protein